MKKKPDSFEEENQKYFDEKQYRTIIVGKDGLKSNDDIAEAIEAISEDKIGAEERDELLQHLKASQPKSALLKAINEANSNEKRARLIAACWEMDVDCRDEFLFFVEYACSDDFNVALEALTVVESIENAIGKERLDEAHKIVKEKIKQNPVTINLLHDLAGIIKDRKDNS